VIPTVPDDVLRPQRWAYRTPSRTQELVLT
jgi:hypothetical protein